MPEAPVTPEPVEPIEAEESEVEKQAFLDRLKQQSAKTQTEKEARVKAEKELADLRAQFEESQNAGLPELERERKAREAAEKRAQDAETAAEKATQNVALARAERWVLAAAKDFIDADDAVRNIDLTDIEDTDAAEKAVKRVAKAKPHLLKGEEKPLPGRVLENGKQIKDPEKQALVDGHVQEASDLAAELAKHIR